MHIKSIFAKAFLHFPKETLHHGGNSNPGLPFFRLVRWVVTTAPRLQGINGFLFFSDPTFVCTLKQYISSVEKRHEDPNFTHWNSNSRPAD
jgi:hypothetical protein